MRTAPSEVQDEIDETNLALKKYGLKLKVLESGGRCIGCYAISINEQDGLDIHHIL